MNTTRRLAAIVAADIAGYSRLMGEDEVGTVQALRKHREAADPLIAQHGGRIVKTTGDGVLTIPCGARLRLRRSALPSAVAAPKRTRLRRQPSQTRRTQWRLEGMSRAGSGTESSHDSSLTSGTRARSIWLRQRSGGPLSGAACNSAFDATAISPSLTVAGASRHSVIPSSPMM